MLRLSLLISATSLTQISRRGSLSMAIQDHPPRLVFLLATGALFLSAAASGCSGDAEATAPSDQVNSAAGGGRTNGIAGFPFGGTFNPRPSGNSGNGDGDGDGDGEGTGGGHPNSSGLPCNAPNAKPLPARASVMTQTRSSSPMPVFTRDLYNSFQSHCGACHVDTNLGGFDGERINFDNFAQLVTKETLDVVRSDDEDEYMPPPVAGGKPYSNRQDSDPIVTLVELLELWIAEGSPGDVFFVTPEVSDEDSPYLLTPSLGRSLTNIGNCMPDKEFFFAEDEKARELDDMWEEASELPLRLRDTDLFTLDHAQLAFHGVVAYAPTYPLWSDDAGKLRHMRLPIGTSIAYDAQRKEFELPKNTRFYKTFLKEVIDSSGERAWRKIETRLIVVRHDDCSSGTCVPQALFGTYAWNDDETAATLVQDPLRNGEPFRDRLITYLTDEQRAADAEGDAAALAEVTRRYAIPGSERCLQCHMGSPSESFILGFTPLQVKRYPFIEEADPHAVGQQLDGQGVLKEHDPGSDELDQLDRLIDYKIISGLDDVQQIQGLRDSQQKQPRNAFELRAQGYMLGNCAHCHNPRGYTSIQNPELSQVLDLFPGESGGIFGFPLESFSPRTSRGKSLDKPVPYVTPSLYDVAGQDRGSVAETKCHINPRNAGPLCVEAPWRSLIYRNVDTPFTYADDFAIFPHMPRHAPGFHCDAPHIMADWMVSIPATLKETDSPERESELAQPWQEVVRGQSGYAEAVAKAKNRLKKYREGDRYNWCPDTSDIQDPEVLSGKYIVPEDHGYFIEGQPALPFTDFVPDRPHWVVSDLTTAPGDWIPRRGDWADIVLKKDADKVEALAEEERRVIDKLIEWDVRLTDDLRNFALAEIPYGTWLDEDGRCSDRLADFPTVDELSPEPLWARELISAQDRSKKVFPWSPGAAVFSNICSKCHGRSGDATGILASTIADMTGGATRVANLRDGFLGPVGEAGRAQEMVFGVEAREQSISTRDLASRYLVWMALGGTQVKIPELALDAVQNSRILGQPRRNSASFEASANMLSTAIQLCGAVMQFQSAEFHGINGIDHKETSLIHDNGDARMWEEICNFGQKAPIRVAAKGSTFEAEGSQPSMRARPLVALPGTGSYFQMIDQADYGDGRLMTRAGVQTDIPADEPVLWCFDRPTDPTALLRANEFYSSELGVEVENIPYCPQDASFWTEQQIQDYMLRGAMNAGLVVFAYLDAIARDEIEPQLEYNECAHLAGN